MSYGARKRRPGVVTIQGRMSSGSAWAGAVAELTRLEASALVLPPQLRNGQERRAAARAMAKVRRVVRLMLGGRGLE